MIQPAHVLPDTHSVFLGENIQHVYKVQFDSAELWGQEARKLAMNLELYSKTTWRLPDRCPDPRLRNHDPAAHRVLPPGADRGAREDLTERGLVTSQVLDGLIKTYEQDVGPMNGAKVVAKAWAGPGVPRPAFRG